MFIKKFVLRAAGASLAAIAFLTAQQLRAESSSDTARLEKLERAVELLQKQNAELKAEVSSLKKHAAPSAVAAVPEGKTKTQVTYDGKTYVEKAVVEEEKPPVYVQQRGPELKLVLGGFIQMNFEDGDVSAFEGRFGQTALKDRFRLRRARIKRSRPRTFLSTGINSRGRRSRWVSGKRHLAWNRQLRTRRYIRSSELYRLARLHRNGRSASSSGENRWQPFGLTTQIC